MTTEIGAINATVVDRVTPAMRLYSEESFVRVNGVEEAIRIANDTEYGLSASVFGRDIARAYTGSRAGCVTAKHVNICQKRRPMNDKLDALTSLHQKHAAWRRRFRRIALFAHERRSS